MSGQSQEIDERKIYFKKINSLLDKLDIFRLYKHLLLDIENDHFNFPSPFGLLLGQACHNEDRVIKLENIFSCSILLRMAGNGDSEAQYDIAQVYLFGDILPNDIDRGLFWMSEAAEDGHHLAIQFLKEGNMDGDISKINLLPADTDSFNNLELLSESVDGMIISDKQYQLSYGNIQIKKKILSDLIDEVFNLLYITGSYLDNLIDQYSFDPHELDETMLSKISIYNETITVRINELIYSFIDGDDVKEKIYYYAKMNSLRYNTNITKQ